MQLECKHCHKLLNLPDDKLPAGRPFSFNCPYCKEKNTAEITILEEKPVSALKDAYFVPGSGDDASLAPDQPPLGGISDELNNFDQFTIKQLMNGEADDHLKALVVYDNPDIAEKIGQKLEGMGFQVSVPINQRDAVKQLKFSNFNLVLIQEDYFGTSLSGNYLLKSIQNLDGHSRRGMLVVLISPTMTTSDDLLAFSRSVDAVVNSAELGNIERILISTIGRARKFYSIFREVLAAEGLD